MSNTDGEDTQAEDLLVEMSATMNNLARAYDQKDERLMKYLMDKVYELSHKGISHLMLLDKANEELASLREQLAKKDQEIATLKDERNRYNLAVNVLLDSDEETALANAWNKAMVDLKQKDEEILEWKVRFSDRSLELEDDNKKLTKINNDLVEWMKLMLCRTMPSNVREDIEQIIRQYNNIEISRLSAKLDK